MGRTQAIDAVERGRDAHRPPVSLPSAKSQALAPQAAADPLDEPPGSRPGARRLAGVP